MATSPLFGWEEPDDVDLVKDGAAAIRTLGNAIDTSMGDLLGGTTGQVLSKNSNTNMDFTWVTSDDANAIQNTIVDAKGDLIAASASDVPARLAVGANGQVIVAASGEATGLKYEGNWTSFTPTWTNLTVGNASVEAKYLKIGGLLHFKIKLGWGSTTSISGRVYVAWPVAPISTNAAQTANATVQYEDSGVGPTIGFILNGLSTTSTFAIFSMTSSGSFVNAADLSSTSPFTWATGDQITIAGFYEVAV
jgi:hypothetical protein